MTDLVPSPSLDTWTSNQLVTADWLNRNVRDVQKFLAYAPLTIVTRNASQTIPTNTQATIIFDTEAIDVDNMFEAPSSDLVVRRPGVYAIQFQNHLTPNTTGMRSGHIALNGQWVGSSNNGSANGGATMLNCSAIVACTTGDVITGMVWQNSGGSLTTGSATFHAPRMAVRLISVAEVDIDYISVQGSDDPDNPNPPDPIVNPPAPPPSQPPASTPTQHTKTFYATWSRSFDGDLGTTWDDSKHCYQGYEAQYRGMTRSLVGFDYGSIQSTLKDSTNISVVFGYKVLHTWYNSGGTIVVGASRYTSKPSTWSSARYWKLLSKSGCVAGKSYTVTLPSGTGDKFRTGEYLGMAFGPAPNTSLIYYGYMAGALETKPYLKFTYWK